MLNAREEENVRDLYRLRMLKYWEDEDTLNQISINDRKFVGLGFLYSSYRKDLKSNYSKCLEKLAVWEVVRRYNTRV